MGWVECGLHDVVDSRLGYFLAFRSDFDVRFEFGLLPSPFGFSDGIAVGLGSPVSFVQEFELLYRITNGLVTTGWLRRQ